MREGTRYDLRGQEVRSTKYECSSHDVHSVVIRSTKTCKGDGRDTSDELRMLFVKPTLVVH